MKPATLFIAIMIPLFLGAPCSALDPAPSHAVALHPTPVLNTPDFTGVFGGPDGQTLQQDSCGLVRALEFVALPGTPFRIEEAIRKGERVVYRVTTDDYPYPAKSGYFIDSRFVTTSAVKPPPRFPRLPPRETVIANLLAARGSRYVWGGNLRGGIPELLSLFPPHQPERLPPRERDFWQLRGVDCSGLLYEATGGYTPRNTSALVGFGSAVPIAGLSAREIARRIAPLDLIVWNGHVMIALDQQRLIESRPDCTGKRDGVRVRPLGPALEELMKTRMPLDDYTDAAARNIKGFVVMRWYDRAFSTRPRPASAGEK
ncbi:MAG TPA: peptidoglycan endopeptidase [Geobacteraceae bacterium]